METKRCVDWDQLVYILLIKVIAAIFSLVSLPEGKEFSQLENQGTHFMEDGLIQSDHMLKPNATI